MFIDPEEEQVTASREIGADMVELHTGSFANCEGTMRKDELARLAAAARVGNQLGLCINAGHGINYDNLEELFEIPHLVELNIGHSIVSRAIMTGMEQAVREMVVIMGRYTVEQ
tara:strand:- start:253 stop:594 length:342 start_codon:yes stop_codon:yes gene_type:complete